MIIEHKGREYDLNFTYNSFRYMRDLNLAELQDMESRPFMMIGFTEELLLGAINSTPTKKVSIKTVSEIVESKMEDGDLVEFMEGLISLLENSSFFKNLQKKK